MQARYCGILLLMDHAVGMQSIIARFDESKIGQVISNLIENALKFTPSGGSVTVSVTHLSVRGTVKISVTDTGMGIAPVFVNSKYYLARFNVYI